MAHFLTGDEEIRDLLHGDHYRAYLMARSQSAEGYRFGRRQRNRPRIRTRNALRHITGCFRTIIEAIANAKLRRMERELELRGIRLDRPDNERVTPKSRPAER